MPLTKRAISPVNVSRNTIPPSIRRDELQCVANGTIANLTRQLSSLSKHAENIFGEIYHDAMVIHHKSNTLQQRIDRLHAKGLELDANSDQASLNEANMRKAFKSSMLVDQHIFDPSTRPTALAERYAQCDRPPDLDALNPYRDSDIPALSLYTNPSFFFDLWKKETLKEVAERPRRVKSPNDGSKSPKKRRKAQVQMGPMGTTVYNDSQHRNRQISGSRINQQNEVFAFPEEYQAPQALGLQLNFRNQHSHPSNHNIVPPLGMTMHHHPQQNAHPMQSQHHRPAASAQRGSPIVKRPPEPAPSSSSINLDHLPPPDMSILSIDDDEDDLPPPPPPLMMHTSIVHQLPTEEPTTIQFLPPSAAAPTNVPPPPPPPPPQQISTAAASFAAPKPLADTEAGTSSGKSSEPKPADARSDLLAQIQSGFKLKKVQRAEAEAAEKAALETNNVAAILKRRMDQVMGNDDSSSEEGADDDEWDD